VCKVLEKFYVWKPQEAAQDSSARPPDHFLMVQYPSAHLPGIGSMGSMALAAWGEHTVLGCVLPSNREATSLTHLPATLTLDGFPRRRA